MSECYICTKVYIVCVAGGLVEVALPEKFTTLTLKPRPSLAKLLACIALYYCHTMYNLLG